MTYGNVLTVVLGLLAFVVIVPLMTVGSLLICRLLERLSNAVCDRYGWKRIL